MALLDLASRKGFFRVVWELRNGPLKFRPLREACDDISPSVLNRRMKELRDARLVELLIVGYQLTPIGHALCRAFEPISDWANQWSEDLKKHPGKD
jgi:DNA-binding HxlR family transcriptional regulator